MLIFAGHDPDSYVSLMCRICQCDIKLKFRSPKWISWQLKHNTDLCNTECRQYRPDRYLALLVMLIHTRTYITDLLEQRATRVLRPTTNNDFYVPPCRSRYGDRMFSVAGPRLWNSLPAEMKKTCCLVTFKRPLKTHLFRAVYEV